MDVEELNRIAILGSKTAIENELKRLGFIDASKDEKLKKVSLADIAQSPISLVSDTWYTDDEKYSFNAHYHANVKGVENYEYIWANVFVLTRLNRAERRKRTRNRAVYGEFEDDENQVYLPKDILIYAREIKKGA